MLTGNGEGKKRSRQRVWKVNTALIGEAVGKGAAQVRKDIHAGRCVPDSLVGLAKYVLGERWRKGM